MKRKTSALVLAILTTISSFAGMMAYWQPVQAVDNDTMWSLMNKVISSVGSTQNIVLDPNVNALGTHDYVMVGTAAQHTSNNVFTTFGLEISKLNKESDSSYAYPWDTKYSAYNNQNSNWRTMYIQDANRDPHAYNGTERTSFVLNRFLATPGGYGSGMNISENRIGENNMWVIGEGLVHNGIAQTGDAEWLSDYETWGQREEESESRLSFGFDTVNVSNIESNI